MSFQWSISTDKLGRRCQKQLFFREIAASHAARETWRREAFILKQLKTLELWRGTVIHEGIQQYVVPALKRGGSLNWKELAELTIRRAREQLAFSEQRRYRQPGIVKGNHEDFCALIPHETGKGVSKQEFAEVCGEIRTAFERLAALADLWKRLLGRSGVWAEKQFWVTFDEVSIQVKIDLLYERSPGHPTIIDWKSYEIGGDSDARVQTVLYGWALWQKKLYDIKRPEDIELLECQLQDGILINHECSQEVFDDLEDYIYRSVNRIFSLCRSKKLAEAKLEDFAFTDNPNNCEHCVFRQLCIERASGFPNVDSVQPAVLKQARPFLQPSFL